MGRDKGNTVCNIHSAFNKHTNIYCMQSEYRQCRSIKMYNTVHAHEDRLEQWSRLQKYFPEGILRSREGGCLPRQSLVADRAETKAQPFYCRRLSLSHANSVFFFFFYFEFTLVRHTFARHRPLEYLQITAVGHNYRFCYCKQLYKDQNIKPKHGGQSCAQKGCIDISNLAILWAFLAAWHLHLWSHVGWLLWSDTNIASLGVIVGGKIPFLWRAKEAFFVMWGYALKTNDSTEMWLKW